MNDQISVAELREEQLMLLDTLHDYCKEHGITYYLSYGTLIGAIRHKGYIPWDDDIDVIMMRSDYDLFISQFNLSGNSKCKVYSRHSDKKYYLPFAKLVSTSTIMEEEVNSDYRIGIYIDIFPLDYLADEYNKSKSIMRRAYFLNKLLLMKNLTVRKGRKWIKNLLLLVGRGLLKLIPRSMILTILESYCHKVNSGKPKKYSGVMTGISAGDESRVFETEWFQDCIQASFEGKEYDIPKGYDPFLRKLYGDYMKLPPREQQKSHHVFRAWRI